MGWEGAGGRGGGRGGAISWARSRARVLVTDGVAGSPAPEQGRGAAEGAGAPGERSGSCCQLLGVNRTPHGTRLRNPAPRNPLSARSLASHRGAPPGAAGSSSPAPAAAWDDRSGSGHRGRGEWRGRLRAAPPTQCLPRRRDRCVTAPAFQVSEALLLPAPKPSYPPRATLSALSGPGRRFGRGREPHDGSLAGVAVQGGSRGVGAILHPVGAEPACGGVDGVGRVVEAGQTAPLTGTGWSQAGKLAGSNCVGPTAVSGSGRNGLLEPLVGVESPERRTGRRGEATAPSAGPPRQVRVHLGMRYSSP